jgi:hypothetical protein
VFLPDNKYPAPLHIRPVYGRYIGADWLRSLTLLSIILFHVVWQDAQFAKAASLATTEWFDVFLVVSTIFDNRSLVVLSFFLLFAAGGAATYNLTIMRRAKRLLVPYLAWTSIYPWLDLALSAVSGRYQTHIARISSFDFWLSGFFLGTVKEHLHFLPTLFGLTLIFPLFKMTCPIIVAIALIVAASVVRAVGESFIVGDILAPAVPIPDLVFLSGMRVIEYLPLGVFAFALARATNNAHSGRWRIATAALCAIVAVSIAMKPTYLIGTSAGATARMPWLIAQAALGTVVMCLAARLILLVPSDRASSVANDFGRFVEERGLAIFLMHPFFVDLFNVIIGTPEAYSWVMATPKLLFAIVCSLLSSSVLIRTAGLRAIV